MKKNIVTILVLIILVTGGVYLVGLRYYPVAVVDWRLITLKAFNDNYKIASHYYQKFLETYSPDDLPKLKEDKIPNVNGNAEILDSRTEQKETQPPRRYSPASIISELEKRNLGTKSTRSSILETLYDRNYIEGQSIKATPFGISLIESLEKYSPIIIDEKLTHDFEEDMEEIGKIYPAEENKKTVNNLSMELKQTIC